MAIDRQWFLVSSHGAPFSYIAANPGMTAEGIADALCLTRRTGWGLVADLRRAGTVSVHRGRRRDHYRVNLDAEVRHPVIRGILLRGVVGPLAARATGGSCRERAGVI